MKASSPVDRLSTLKIMPLHAKPLTAEIAIQRPPAIRDTAPRFSLCRCFDPCSHSRGNLRATSAGVQVGFLFRQGDSIPIPQSGRRVIGALRKLEERFI